jgi:hypothetical protein
MTAEERSTGDETARRKAKEKFYAEGYAAAFIPAPDPQLLVIAPPAAKLPLYVLVINLALGAGWPIDQTPDLCILEVGLHPNVGAFMSRVRG